MVFRCFDIVLLHSDGNISLFLSKLNFRKIWNSAQCANLFPLTQKLTKNSSLYQQDCILDLNSVEEKLDSRAVHIIQYALEVLQRYSALPMDRLTYC